MRTVCTFGILFCVLATTSAGWAATSHHKKTHPAESSHAQTHPSHADTSEETTSESDDADTTAVRNEEPDPLMGLHGRPDADELPITACYSAFNTALQQFQAAYAQTQRYPAFSKKGRAQRITAIDAAMDVRDLLGSILRRAPMSDNDRASATNTWLNVQELMGTLMVDLRACDRAEDVLRDLKKNPETKSRQKLYDATSKWLHKAKTCAREQRAPTDKLGNRNQYGFRVHGGWQQLPNYFVNGAFKLRGHIHSNGRVGGSFFIKRKGGKRELSANYDYTRIPVDASWWLKQNQQYKKARWIDFGRAPIHTFSVGIMRQFQINADPHLKVFVGGLFGFMILPTRGVRERRADRSCLSKNGSADAPDATQGHLNLFKDPVRMPDPADPTNPDKYTYTTTCKEKYGESVKTKIPPIFPSIGVHVGFQYLLAPRVRIGADVGFQDGYFFLDGIISVLATPKYKNPVAE